MSSIHSQNSLALKYPVPRICCQVCHVPVSVSAPASAMLILSIPWASTRNSRMTRKARPPTQTSPPRTRSTGLGAASARKSRTKVFAAGMDPRHHCVHLC
ncbi:hypothetical protein B0H14DRAFT_3853221, partial [Mycena olivaceomarginata]